ncbi:hypothetical protein CR073_024580, partial [Escherichia coli]|nr:hypothetical protein [Escherichia coli]
ELGQMPGLKQMRAKSPGGASFIPFRSQQPSPPDAAGRGGQAALTAATIFWRGVLPTPPFYRKVTPADTPIMPLAVPSTAMPMT